MARSGSDLSVAAAAATGATVSALGLVAVFAWLSGFAATRPVLPHIAAVTFEIALGLTLSGVALVCLATRSGEWGKRVAYACAAVVVLTSLLTLAGYLLAADVDVGAPVAPSQEASSLPILDDPPFMMAICFILYGAAVFLVNRERLRRAFLTVVTAGTALSLMRIVDSLYDALFRPAQTTFVDFCASVALFGAFVGAAALRPDTGWIALIRSRGPGGAMARGLIPGIVLLLPIVGALKLQGQYAGLYDVESGIALFVTLTVLFFVAVVWFVGRRVDLLDEQARASERRYRQVVDEIHEGIWIHADGIIVFANACAAQVFGARSPKDLIGRSVLDFFHEDDRERAANRLRTLYDEETAVEPTEMRIVRLDRKVVVVGLHSMRFIADGRHYVMSTGHDVTAQREAEGHLRRFQRMEAVAQLTGGVAHEFNNLLTIIMGNAELLTTDLVESKKRPELAEKILLAAERGSDLTARLMAFSRLEPLEPQHIDANIFLRDLEERLKRVLGSGVELSLQHAEDPWPLAADPSQLELAMLNLATNARDAMPSGGRLTIAMANVHLEESDVAESSKVRSGDYVMLAVADTGSGMPRDVLDRAFEPFFTTKEPGKGTGLGLSIVFGFAKQSRGHVTIESEVGRGTLVRLYLPRAEVSIPATSL